MAACASASEPISTKPKPRERPVSGLVRIATLLTDRPPAENALRKESSVVVKLRLPT